uniref:Bm1440 n=3 Tax=Brugia malayi TaxID=6279 RepID=A0A0H5SAB5_BRUMA|nr:Bm1440 [Brugia malayi]
MDGCVAGAFGISLVVDALCSHSRGINRRALTLSLMVLSYATLILSSSDEANSLFIRINTTSMETTTFTEYAPHLYYATTTIEPETTIVTENSESESHQKFIISESTQTLLASTIGRRHISGYIKNSSFSNTQMMKIARKNEMHKNGRTYLYILVIICIACGLVSMTIFSLLYFHFILPSP